MQNWVPVHDLGGRPRIQGVPIHSCIWQGKIISMRKDPTYDIFWPIAYNRIPIRKLLMILFMTVIIIFKSLKSFFSDCWGFWRAGGNFKNQGLNKNLTDIWSDIIRIQIAGLPEVNYLLGAEAECYDNWMWPALMWVFDLHNRTHRHVH